MFKFVHQNLNKVMTVNAMAATTASPWALLDSLVSLYMCMDSCRPNIQYPYREGTLRETKRYNVGYPRYRHFWKCQKQWRNKIICTMCFWRTKIIIKQLIITVRRFCNMRCFPHNVSTPHYFDLHPLLSTTMVSYQQWKDFQTYTYWQWKIWNI